MSSDNRDSLVLRSAPMLFADIFLTICPNAQLITLVDSLEKTVSIGIFKHPNPSTNKNIRAILSSCIFFIISSIFKQKRGRAKSLDSALCENEAGALSANSSHRNHIAIVAFSHIKMLAITSKGTFLNTKVWVGYASLVQFA